MVILIVITVVILKKMGWQFSGSDRMVNHGESMDDRSSRCPLGDVFIYPLVN